MDVISVLMQLLFLGYEALFKVQHTVGTLLLLHGLANIAIVGIPRVVFFLLLLKKNLCKKFSNTVGLARLITVLIGIGMAVVHFILHCVDTFNKPTIFSIIFMIVQPIVHAYFMVYCSYVYLNYAE